MTTNGRRRTMPRKIEVQLGNGTWEPWTMGSGAAAHSGYPWRYVGGVLEVWWQNGWHECHPKSQSNTLEEMQALSPQDRYRLRPYDDAPTCQHQLTFLDTGRCTKCGVKVHAPGDPTQYDVAPITSSTEVSAEKLLEGRAISGMEQWLPNALRCSLPSWRATASWTQPDANAKGGYVHFCEEHRKRLDATPRWIVGSPDVDLEHLKAERERASRLSDECGALRTERDELLRENAQWRRKYEQLERKVKR
jgi:hypothetical protein